MVAKCSNVPQLQQSGKQRCSYQIGNSIGRQVEEEFQLRQISER
jgi:hypothetical protein